MPLAITFVTTGAWGSGTGAPLPAATIDGNFWAIKQFCDDLEANPPEPNQISNIVVDGTQMTIYLEGGASFGPFTLPQANFRPAITDDEAVPTDGTYELVSADANRYKRFDGPVTVVVNSGIGMAVDSEIYFRAAGGIITFDAATAVTINVPTGFLAQTSTIHGAVVLKCVAADEYDLEGRLAEDVTA